MARDNAHLIRFAEAYLGGIVPRPIGGGMGAGGGPNLRVCFYNIASA